MAISEADLARIEAAVGAWRARQRWPDHTCEDVAALVAEVRRLRAALAALRTEAEAKMTRDPAMASVNFSYADGFGDAWDVVAQRVEALQKGGYPW